MKGKKNALQAYRLRQVVAARMGTNSETYRWVRQELRKGTKAETLAEKLRAILESE